MFFFEVTMYFCFKIYQNGLVVYVWKSDRQTTFQFIILKVLLATTDWSFLLFSDWKTQRCAVLFSGIGIFKSIISTGISCIFELQMIIGWQRNIRKLIRYNWNSYKLSTSLRHRWTACTCRDLILVEVIQPISRHNHTRPIREWWCDTKTAGVKWSYNP